MSNNFNLVCIEEQTLLFEQIKINKKVQVILMTIPVDKKAKEKKTFMPFFKSISVTNLAQRVFCDHHSQAKQNLAPQKHHQQ